MLGTAYEQQSSVDAIGFTLLACFHGHGSLAFRTRDTQSIIRVP